MIDYMDICRQAQFAAVAAGEYVLSQRDIFRLEDIEYKGAHDMVSYVDRKAEELLVSQLGAILPEAGFLTEEGTVNQEEKRLMWVIDPLDGTTNFIHGLPPYCVSVALTEEGETVVGVIFEITSRELYYAWKGSDAFLNEKKITASSIDNLSGALVAIGFSHKRDERRQAYIEAIARYQETTDGIRRIGSAAMDLAYVACGRLDAFVQRGLAPWDVAAGAFIALRAGAVVTDFSGGGNYINDWEIIATAPGIYPQFRRTIEGL